MAGKVAVGIIAGERQDPLVLERWFSEGTDVRADPRVGEDVLAFTERHGVKTVAMAARIIGRPHEEGVDDDGPTCPMCPFRAGRDRWTGKRR